MTLTYLPNIYLRKYGLLWEVHICLKHNPHVTKKKPIVAHSFFSFLTTSISYFLYVHVVPPPIHPLNKPTRKWQTEVCWRAVSFHFTAARLSNTTALVCAACRRASNMCCDKYLNTAQPSLQNSHEACNSLQATAYAVCHKGGKCNKISMSE